MEVFIYGSVKPKLHDFLLSAGISLKETTVWSGKLGWGVCGASEALEIPQLENQGSSQQVPPRKGPKRPAMKSSSWEEGGADREGPSWSEDLGTSGLSKSQGRGGRSTSQSFLQSVPQGDLGSCPAHGRPAGSQLFQR